MFRCSFIMALNPGNVSCIQICFVPFVVDTDCRLFYTRMPVLSWLNAFVYRAFYIQPAEFIVEVVGFLDKKQRAG